VAELFLQWRRPRSSRHLSNQLHRKNGKLPCALQWRQKVQARSPNLQRRKNHPRRVATLRRHLHPRPANMQADQRNPNPKLPRRVHRVYNADSRGDVPRSVWEFVFHVLDDYFGRVRKVGHKPDQRALANQSDQPHQSGHICSRDSSRTCNCPRGACADDDATYRHARGPYLRAPEPSRLGNFRCPVSGQICSSGVCREWCEGSGAGTEAGADRRAAKAAQYYRNIDIETGTTR
jgi:hypothetical protein